MSDVETRTICFPEPTYMGCGPMEMLMSAVMAANADINYRIEKNIDTRRALLFATMDYFQSLYDVACQVVGEDGDVSDVLNVSEGFYMDSIDERAKMLMQSAAMLHVHIVEGEEDKEVLLHLVRKCFSALTYFVDTEFDFEEMSDTYAIVQATVLKAKSMRGEL